MRISLVFAVTMISISLCVSTYRFQARAGSVLVVSPSGNGDFISIKDAVSNASSGDIIFVDSGTYFENVVINKTLSLIGQDPGNTIIDGNATGTNIIRVVTNDVLIENFTIRGALLADSAGIRADLASRITIRNNNISSNFNGLVFYTTSASVISNNLFTLNSNGAIGFFRSANNTIRGNTIIHSSLGSGIRLTSFSDNNRIIGNVISNNSLSGLVMSFSDGNIISGNSIVTNGIEGIRFDQSNFNFVSGNLISLNTNVGLSLLTSINNTITANTISGNSVYGVETNSYSNNTLYHNNLENPLQAHTDQTSSNRWSVDGEGNFWSDATLVDANGDGIRDNPYVIDQNNQDEYPLSGAFSTFRVSYVERQYDVTTISNSTISEFMFQPFPETKSRTIQFNATGKNETIGFCRIRISTGLLDSPILVMVGNNELTPSLLPSSGESSLLYFTYPHTSQIIRLVSSDILRAYNDLIETYSKLSGDLNTLKNNQTMLLNNYTAFILEYRSLNASYNDLLTRFSANTESFRNLTYVFALSTGTLIAGFAYFSKRRWPHDQDSSSA